MAHTKEEWRQRLSEARRALDAPVRAAHSRVIAERIAARPEFAASAALLIYLPIGAEVDPTPLLADGRSIGKAIYRPHGETETPRWIRHRPVEGSGAVAFGEPIVVPPEARLLAIVPGMGFDLEGVRL